ncbi:BsaA family SipW-dependent biofilm matrix protein [Candidatus Enterococcus mansonii]|uniref:Alternate signal-mediated exported protein n=1 Tax=Candidatus Enterococcus mansonii TaxID=1834181 RepID=A0A242CHE2_9ENTE|nr:BsaA family SipW-dependent biofilm matrix protein [Enterococcus sp. 4G2_DIV0659]OTO09657.1 hypothetical protein A5880_000337 [Enterococcus sp. 4G2_DIV0659]
MKSKKKKLLIAASVLALTALGAGTFAWFTSEDKVTNHFEGEIAGNDIQIVETFTPEKDWTPGEGVAKKVSVANVSEYDALIRISFDEMFKKLRNNNEIYFDGEGKYIWASGPEKGKELANAPVVPKAMPSKSEYVSLGYIDVTSNLTTAVQNITIDNKEYSFKMYEKEVQAAGTKPSGEVIPEEYSYVAQWEAADGTKAKAYIGNTSGTVNRDRTTSKLTLVNPAYLCMIDATYNETSKKWADPNDLYNKPSVDDITYKAFADDLIQLGFKELAKDITNDKWYYNQADGYFYFIGKVLRGTQTPQLLESVKLMEAADNSYSLLQFDLTVNAQGIQNAQQSIKDTWKTDVSNKALYDKLVEFCDY